MGADLGVPLSDLRLLCVSVAGGEVRCATIILGTKRRRFKAINCSFGRPALRNTVSPSSGVVRIGVATHKFERMWFSSPNAPLAKAKRASQVAAGRNQWHREGTHSTTPVSPWKVERRKSLRENAKSAT